MKTKNLVICVLLLAVASGLVYFMKRPGPPLSTDARIGQPLADPITIEKAAKLKLSDQGKTVELNKTADGLWHVSSYYDLPVDLAKLSRFVGDLTEAKLQRLVTTSADRISRLEFKDTQITFAEGAGKELWSATFGKTSDNGGRFVRFGSEQKAYLASLNAWLDVDAKNWANSQIVDLKSDDIAKVELSFPDEAGVTVVASRPKKEDPFVAEKSLEGKKLKTETINSLLASITGLRFSETSEPNDPKAVAAKDHARTIKLTTFAGQTTTIAIGRKPEEKIIKAPVAAAGKTGPAALLPSTSPDAKAPGAMNDVVSGGPAKAVEPTTETVPAGPVYVSITSPNAQTSAATLFQKRAVSVSDFVFTSLPQKTEDLFESNAPVPVIPPPAAPAPEAKP